MKTIKFEQVTKNFGKWNIIKGINIEFDKEKIYAIMGPSGAGKTTFLNLASGLEKPSTGKIFVNNELLSEMQEPKLTKFRVKNISYIFQDYNLIDYLNVYENVVLSCRLAKVKVDEVKVNEILEKVKLLDLKTKNVMSLSGGQKQRVAIARSLIGENKIIFADEPTGALDLSTRDEVIKLLSDVTKIYKKTLVVITHDPNVAAIADEVVYLLNGQISSVEKKQDALTITNRLLELEKNANSSN